MNLRRVLCTAGIAASSALGGCYVYREVDLAAVPAGEEVRVELGPRGRARLLELGVEDGAVGEGILVGSLLRRDGRLVLRTPLGGGAGRPGTIFRELPLDAEDVRRVDSRRLSGLRSGAALVGGGVLSAATVVLIIRDAEGESRLPGPGGPDDLRGLPHP